MTSKVLWMISLMAMHAGFALPASAAAPFPLKPMYCENQLPGEQPVFFILKKGKNTEWVMHNRQGKRWLVVPFSLDDVFRTINDYPSFSKKAKAKFWLDRGILLTTQLEFRSGEGISGYRMEDEFYFSDDLKMIENFTEVFSLSGVKVGQRTFRPFACQDLTPELDTTEDL